MTKLHALLAAENSVTSAAAKLFTETEAKMGKEDTYFKGHIKTLKLANESVTKEAEEKAGSDRKVLATTVPDTLRYMLDYWINAEDILFQKNRTNQVAKADIFFDGEILVANVPVDELLGLEARLPKLRELILKIPTLDASKSWTARPDIGPYVWQTTNPEVTTKTEKRVEPVVLYAATDKHPAQVKEYSRDEVIGSFEQIRQSGAITAYAKSEALANIDKLIVEVKKARTRANEVEVVDGNIGHALIDAIFAPIFIPAKDQQQ